MEIAMKIALTLLLAVTGVAQPLRVYSEFARIDAQGEAMAPESPREILSPTIVRNGYTSFQIVAQVPKGAVFTLHVGQNPEGALKVTVYKEPGGRVELPYQSESTQIFWMDLWADRDAPVRRIKIEPQLFLNGDWVVYPMEVRVSEAIVPDAGAVRETAAAPLDAMRNFLCGGKPKAGASSGWDRLRSRNAGQDIALAARASAADRGELIKILGGCQAALPAGDPESYLKLRDFLFKMR
jgi:hypothetical protein